MKNQKRYQQYSNPALLSLAVSIALLGGCSSDSDSDKDDGSSTLATQKAIVATVASDFSAGAHAAIDATAPYTVEQDLVATGSDITVNAFETNFYRIERFNSDSVIRFEVATPSTVAAQFSTLDAGEEGSSNPHALVFENDSKAYLLRYGKTKAWIVNPLAAPDGEFKIGEIDLSDYDPGDGSVEMTAGVISKGKLFILMQRFNAGFVPQDAYVAVFDTASNIEIDTETNALKKGILLPVKNPNDIQLDDNGEIYISAAGHGFAENPEDKYTGGIATLDSESYEATMLLDDGDAEDHPYENITDLEIVSADKGYFVSYKGYQNTSLYAFNPTTGAVDAEPLESMSGINLSGLATDSANRLWVSVSSSTDRAAGIRIYNTADNSLAVDEIAISLDPKAIVFGNTSNQ